MYIKERKRTPQSEKNQHYNKGFKLENLVVEESIYITVTPFYQKSKIKNRKTKICKKNLRDETEFY